MKIDEYKTVRIPYYGISDFDGCSLGSMQTIFNTLVAEYGSSSIFEKVYEWGDSHYIIVKTVKKSDEEIAAEHSKKEKKAEKDRLRRIKDKQTKEAKEIEEFERLKKKYGDKQ